MRLAFLLLLNRHLGKQYCQKCNQLILIYSKYIYAWLKQVSTILLLLLARENH